MEEHLNVAAVQKDACAALFNLSAHSDNNVVDGIEAVLAAMKEHPKDRNVQEGACAALWNLSSHNDNKKLRLRRKVEWTLLWQQ